MLSAHDPLPFRPQRILIAGVTGSGKTTLARRIGQQWGLPAIEIDALFHGPDWTPRAQFLDDVRAFAGGERWVTEWLYGSQGTNAILAPRAQLVIWLDYPYGVVRGRLLRRTFLRRLLRIRLWNGNVEKPLWQRLGTDPKTNILQWQHHTLHTWDARMPEMTARFPHLTIVRLKTPRDTTRWLRINAP
jgi:adenylate kinase family enzyme